ncbi:MAG: ferrous iron transport protein B [Calditrichae bacterium]|nr:ferrous iron transport protein B [Calditrichia bacterium]
MKIALVGQPNSGKSTIFNAVAGYKSVTSNLPGTTVAYMEGRVRLNGDIYDLVDFPGTYSLSSTNEAEAQVSKYLLREKFDLIINIIDASQLGRSLPLTLELIDLGIPIIVALNMMDEASRKGIEIDVEELAQLLNLPVQTTIASKNLGVRDLFQDAKEVIENGKENVPQSISCQRDVEEIITELEEEIQNKYSKKFIYPPRFLAIKLLEDDHYYQEILAHQNGTMITEKVNNLQQKLVQLRGKPQDSVLVLERHAMAMDIYGKIVKIVHPHRDWRDKLDNVVMHRVGGYVILLTILLSFFYIIFEFGALFEGLLLTGFEELQNILSDQLNQQTFWFHLIQSIVWGISGGIAIVLPYLIPFLIGLTILEDIGYLPRVAFLMDTFMHRIGLHGTSIIPAVLGYGCNVPAVMATRILPSRRDKIIAAVISSMVPCSARSVVIFGLVAFYLGPLWAFAIYLFNIVVISLTGKVLSMLMPEVTPGMILEIPPYRWPSFQVVRKKTWFRIKEFIIVAWPILILGSIVLGLLEYFQLDKLINQGLSPLTILLGLPAVVGTTLIFGVLRKELSLIMLTQAIGTTQILSVLSTTQVLTFTIFITFYIPCIATMAVLAKELNRFWMTAVILITLILAILFSLIIRMFGHLIL